MWSGDLARSAKAPRQHNHRRRGGAASQSFTPSGDLAIAGDGDTRRLNLVGDT